MITRKECDEARFLNDVAKHKMVVLFDDGNGRRQLRFMKENASSAHWFDVSTWGGTLCITGDMGCYVFQRLPDMFEFFRMSEHDWNRNPSGLSINPGYWAEKLVASSGHTEWDAAAFTAKVHEFRDDFMKAAQYGVSEKDRQELWRAVDEEVLWLMDDQHAASIAVHEFFFQAASGKKFTFVDFFDSGTERFTFLFLWCCYAIVWGINQYDAAKAAKP